MGPNNKVMSFLGLVFLVLVVFTVGAYYGNYGIFTGFFNGVEADKSNIREQFSRQDEEPKNTDYFSSYSGRQVRLAYVVYPTTASLSGEYFVQLEAGTPFYAEDNGVYISLWVFDKLDPSSNYFTINEYRFQKDEGVLAKLESLSSSRKQDLSVRFNNGLLKLVSVECK
jgi:hypothetical protein